MICPEGHRKELSGKLLKNVIHVKELHKVTDVTVNFHTFF
jgi:hypothetical protein